MIKHIVSFKLKETAEGKTKAENSLLMKKSLESLKEKIAAIKKLEVGINSPKADTSNFDIILITEFESFEGLQEYLIHPEHVKVAEFIGKVRESRSCIDYEF
jgi:hypothetical protein